MEGQSRGSAPKPLNDFLFLVLAWLFVALRIINHVSSVGAVLMASAIVLAIMWIIYAVRLLLIVG